MNRDNPPSRLIYWLSEVRLQITLSVLDAKQVIASCFS